ncbi:hypothetical protein OsI_02198 [Oryza sativa Indica Group]|uniref:Uncharacterized protein n=1 Tax=Oryza sativa subsp. indica TaxID=39946 RepID=A2WQR3_ORYSI|nr:hypothetical protein OsI_02198 [Oryza sativa Indica Group]
MYRPLFLKAKQTNTKASSVPLLSSSFKDKGLLLGSMNAIIMFDGVTRTADQILEKYLSNSDRPYYQGGQSIYFDGWKGFGTSAILADIAELARRKKSMDYEIVLHVDCSVWESRRTLQRMIAKELNLGGSTMALFDKQDGDDDFSGIEKSSRAEIDEVAKLIFQAVKDRSCLLIVHNGSDDEIDFLRFGVPVLERRNTVLWTFRGRFRLEPAIKDKVKNADLFLSIDQEGCGIIEGDSAWEIADRLYHRMRLEYLPTRHNHDFWFPQYFGSQIQARDYRWVSVMPRNSDEYCQITRIQALDLEAMQVQQLERLFLLGCANLTRVKWIDPSNPPLKLLCIDTRGKAARAMDGVCQGSHLFTQQEHEAHPSTHVVATDARFLRGFRAGGYGNTIAFGRYVPSQHFHLHISDTVNDKPVLPRAKEKDASSRDGLIPGFPYLDVIDKVFNNDGEDGCSVPYCKHPVPSRLPYRNCRRRKQFGNRTGPLWYGFLNL